MRTNYMFINLVALLATILLASCSELQTDGDTMTDGTRTFTFNLTADGQAHTRAAAPDVTDYKLEYFLQVLGADGNAIDGYTESASNSTGQFEVALPVGAAYTCLFWADYVPATGDAANEFFTATQLKAVTLKKNLTDESRCQAFCGKAEVANGETVTAHDITLKRAVAQVNIKTATQMIGYSKLTASYTGVPNTFHVADNTVTTDAGGTVNTQPSFEVTDFSTDPDTDGTLYTNQSAYVLASPDGTGSMLEITIETQDAATGGTTLQTLTVPNVPAKKNYKTNILVDFDPANLEHTYSFGFAEWDAEEDFEPGGWDGVIPDADATYPFGGGDGAEATPYIIAEPVHLAYLAANVNAGPGNNGTFYENKYFKLTQNINLGNQLWDPIGRYVGYSDSGNRLFMGHFDGNHKQVRNLKVERDDLRYVGLFGSIQGSIKNLHVVNANVTNTRSGWPIAGGICGYINGTNDRKEEISGCSFKGKVTCLNGAAGGICGAEQGGGIIASKNLATSIIQGKNAGGIIGSVASGEVYGCYNEGSVSASGVGGGICGSILDAGACLYGCYNTGAVAAIGEGSTKLAAIAVENDGYGNEYILGVCYVVRSYDTTPVKPDCEKVFGGEVGNWPVGTDATSIWYLAVDADGSFSVDHGNFTCQLWKSLGAWNGGAPVYPKLWWEK